MGWIEGTVEILAPDGEGYDEVAFECEYDYRPAEPAVMDVNSPFVGPGCDASADLIEESVCRKDGGSATEIIGDVKAWWRRHGETAAIEREEDGHARRRGRIPHDLDDAE